MTCDIRAYATSVTFVRLSVLPSVMLVDCDHMVQVQQKWKWVDERIDRCLGYP